MVKTLDLGFGSQPQNNILLGFALKILSDLIFYFFKFRGLMLAFFFNFQDMPAKLGFNRRGNLAGSCFKGDFSKCEYNTSGMPFTLLLQIF